MLKKVSLVLALCLAVGYSAVNYPYPQRKNYGNGTINATSSRASAELKGKFENFVRDFYVEGTCGGTACARIKFDSPNENQTVSEGIGYAMIMMVYFSDNTKSYQTHFDKLWAYYKHFSNSNGVMNWKIDGFSGTAGQNGATDAELDAAFALAMARYQFGDTKYSTEATTLIGKIKQHEVSSDGLLKPGDAWDADRNPSYVSPAAFEIFKDLGTSSDWSTALTRNYKFLKDNQNGTTGLPSGWANSDGSTKVCSNNCGITTIAYDQDAVRAPWRWAWANAWYGHADAKTLLGKLGGWVNGKDPIDIKGPIKLDGSMGTDASSGYIGSLMCALTASSSHQSKLNSYWSTLVGKAGESYFNQALQVLFGLLVTGNMPNLKGCASCTDMDEGGYSGGKTSIDKFDKAGDEDDDDRGYARTWEPWIAYTDIDNGKADPACTADPDNGPGASTITNTKFTSKDENDNCKEVTSYTVVLKDGNDWTAKIPSYTLSKGQNAYAPYVALGLLAKNNGTDYKLSDCQGFSYEYKGSAHNFKAQSKAIPDCEGSDHVTTISTAATNWTPVEIAFADLEQPSWATTKHTFDPAKVEGFIWELKGHDKGPPEVGVSANTGSFAIKNFKCLGEMKLEATRGASKCNETPRSSSSARSSSSGGGSSSGGSSSSVGNSSSSVGSGGSSSSMGSSSSVSGSSSSRGSSSSGGGGGSSSSGGNTPVILSNAVFSNGLNAMQNAVNLQSTGNSTVQIFDLKGNSVRTFSFTQGNYIVSMADLSRGLYIVKASSGSWKQTVTVPVR